MTLVLALAFCLTFTTVGCTWLEPPQPATPPPPPAVTPPVDPESDVYLNRVNEAWSVITEHYVGRDDIDPDALSQAVIRAMIEQIDDPYGAFLDPDEREISLGSSAGRISGIGATVSNRDDKLIIVEPHRGMPAQLAGIRAGDEVVAVDGLLVSEMSYIEAILKVRGPEGTSVTLRVLHKGDTETVEITVIRAQVEIPSVIWEMETDTIAYLRISRFTQRTGGELVDALREIRRSDAESIILDLQNNPGGIVSSVVDTASRFHRDGIVLIVEEKDGQRTELPAVAGNRVTDLPLIVLVNEFTASGGEVLAGYLQYYDRAKVAGNTTFGKGSVNRLYPLRDGSGLYVSVSRWLTAGLEHIEGQGVTPDIMLDLDHEEAITWAVDYLRQRRD